MATFDLRQLLDPQHLCLYNSPITFTSLPSSNFLRLFLSEEPSHRLCSRKRPLRTRKSASSKREERSDQSNKRRECDNFQWSSRLGLRRRGGLTQFFNLWYISKLTINLQVFSSDVTTWWSPTGTKLSFLSFDEEQVPEYEFPVYNSDWNQGGADPYPSVSCCPD